MTQPQANLKDELEALVHSHPVIAEDKLARRMGNIDRMTRFYQEKAPEAPEKQAIMFERFVVALVYAANVIGMYHSLTKKLAELAEDDRIENVNPIKE